MRLAGLLGLLGGLARLAGSTALLLSGTTTLGATALGTTTLSAASLAECAASLVSLASSFLKRLVKASNDATHVNSLGGGSALRTSVLLEFGLLFLILVVLLVFVLKGLDLGVEFGLLLSLGFLRLLVEGGFDEVALLLVGNGGNESGLLSAESLDLAEDLLTLA